MAEIADDKIDSLAEQLKLSIENQFEIKGVLQELREVVRTEGVASRQVLERLVEVESFSDQMSARLSKIEATQLEMGVEERKGKWKVIVIIVTSIIGWMGVLFQKYITG